MKSYESKYIAKIYELLTEGTEDRRQNVLNLMELLGLLISSNKSNAAKVFNCNVEVQFKKVTFSQILNLALLDTHESNFALLNSEIRDCAVNIISQMTEKMAPDRRDYLNMLNGYLLTEMAGYIRKINSGEVNIKPHWSYFYNYFKLLNFCIDKEKNRKNAYLLTTLIEYEVLDSCKMVYSSYKHIKPLRLHYIQLLSGLTCIEEENLVNQVVELNLLDAVWETYKESLKNKNTLYSACLKLLKCIAEDKSLAPFVDYIGERFQTEISQGHFETQRIVSSLMQRYRAQEKARKIQRGETLQPHEAQPVHGDFSHSSHEENNLPSDEERQLTPLAGHRGPRSMKLSQSTGESPAMHEQSSSPLGDSEVSGSMLGKRLPSLPQETGTAPGFPVASSRWGDNQPRIPRGD